MGQLIAPLRHWWQSISQREQRLVAVCVVLIAFGTIYWGILQPLNQQAELTQSRIQSEQQLLAWVKDKANTITTLRRSSGVHYSNQPLNQIIAASARRYHIELIRVQPRKDGVQVWIKPVAFDRFVDWLDFLQNNQGVTVEFMDIDRSEQSGVVAINRLQFKRG